MHTAYLNCMNSLSRCDLALEGYLENRVSMQHLFKTAQLGEAEVWIPVCLCFSRSSLYFSKVTIPTFTI